MKFNRHTYKYLLLFSSLAGTLNAQLGPEGEQDVKPSALIYEYSANHPNETYVIQTDRDMYFPGSTLWFSVWSLDDQSLKPFSYSGIIYVELMDQDGNSVTQQILKIINHKASGSMTFPDQLKSGMYYLRAYSNLQRNHGEAFFGVKLLQLVNPSRPVMYKRESRQKETQITVFPEGQRLVYNSMNNLMVKVTDPDGNQAGLREAFLLNKKSDTIEQIEFVAPGLGYCSFFADTANTYYLELPGIEKFPMEIQDHGYTLQLKEEKDHLNVKVLGTTESAKDKYTVIGKQRGKVFFEQGIENDMKDLIFSYSSLPDGLLEFIILNNRFEEISQRLYYHDPPGEPLSASLVLSKSSYQKREIIHLELQLPEEPEFEFLSLVIRKDLFIHHSVNPDLKSCVDLHPFLNDWDDIGKLSTSLQKDSLSSIFNKYLITQKRSRYSWQRMMEQGTEKLEFRPETDFKLMNASAYNPGNNAKIKNEHLALYIVGKEAYLINAKTDDEGLFCFEYPYRESGTSEIVVQGMNHDQGIEVSVDWPFHQGFYPYQLDFFYFDSTRFEEYNEAYAQSALEKMYRQEEEQISTKNDRVNSFYGDPDSRTYLDDYVTMINMKEVFKEIVPGEKFEVRNDENKLSLYHRDEYYVLGENPLLLFNGAPFQSIEEVLALPVSRIDFIDMLRQNYQLQNQVYNGIMNVVAKDLNLQLKIPANAYKTRLEVFSPKPDFFRSHTLSESRIPMLNPTLYWNPDLSFEGNKHRISIQAGNNSGRYQVLLRGIDTEGNILEFTRYLEIE